MLQEQDPTTPRIVEPDLDMRRLLPVAPPPPVGQIVADDLRNRILSGAWLYDENIPSERQLELRYGASRPTIREALRMLQNEGLIEIRRGKAGGALVRYPAEWSEEKMRNDLYRKLPELMEMLDCRLVIEPYACRRAAARRTPEHLKTLQDSVKRMEEASNELQEVEKAIAEETLLPQAEEDIKNKRGSARLKYRSADNLLHLTVSVAARNSCLLEMYTKLRTKFFTFPAIDLLGVVNTKGRRQEVIKQHRAIVEAIEEHEKDEAEDAMRVHIVSAKNLLSTFLDNELEQHLFAKKKGSREASANTIREVLKKTKVFALTRGGSVNTESTTEGNNIFQFVIEGPDGERQTMVPVFTRLDFIQDAMDRYPDWQELWQELSQSVRVFEGSELLSKLKPNLRVVINPWTALEFRLPVN